MNIRLALLFSCTLSSLSYAMENIDNQADSDLRKITLIEEQIADDQEVKQILIEANRKKIERQKMYNELVEKQVKDTQTIQELINQDFDQAVKFMEKVAQENDARPMKLNPKKLTRLTKTKGVENLKDLNK